MLAYDMIRLRPEEDCENFFYVQYDLEDVHEGDRDLTLRQDKAPRYFRERNRSREIRPEASEGLTQFRTYRGSAAA